MGDVLDTLARAVGAFVLAGGGLVAIVYWLFRAFTERWLSAKFEERLAAFRHAQQEELERLKLEINTLFDRTVKLHQREFDIVPEAWSKLTQAYGVTVSVLSPFQRYADLDRMNRDHLDEFLDQSPLMKWQKQEVRESAKKTDAYIRAIIWHHIANAKNALSDFHLFLQKNVIFVPEPLKTKFLDLDQLLFAALVEHETNEQHGIHPRLSKAGESLSAKGPDLIKSLEQDIQGRLWNAVG